MRARKFNKILVANRGEIALRVIRAARELDIQTVAIHSTADAESLHVKFADESVCIGPPAPAESYLNIPAIISAAEISAADAIHPGYGFLAENANFAETCEASGFNFIGPKPESIRLMGDKIAARRAMREVGLHGLPGSPDPLTDPVEAERLAQEIGFPLIIKAAAGGGGRGMKIVRDPDDLTRLLALAQREAESSFGNGAVYIERFIETPRHVEFQVVADNYGNILHLGERECSVQRRYQKLIEESPSPGLTDTKRDEVGNRIVEALKKLGYTNVGTIEFLMDEAGELYFMEMNTRIQVEHPVTEMMVRRDLLRLQIQLSEGAPLPFEQSDVALRGHAIECRINAEDPVNFAPSPGLVSTFHVPGGAGIRVDSHITTGASVAPYYDSLLAKLIVHDIDRAHAIRRMKSALREFVVEGIQTNIPFHRRILDHPDFASGKYDTTIVQKMFSTP
ncbi:MAG TPA: acetyl-CoA carboxylase biotin carboxylase subunit [Myxococcales bacterium LLY-WYZ-16_1]|jgi:acetyl-CoA carboxylase, biotin carboxylase subunit|nr:acetyl-CoA carboxylase biotin carboxylase subunit [Myxococcales bacterium LLY-WYZ-16_1]